MIFSPLLIFHLFSLRHALQPASFPLALILHSLLCLSLPLKFSWLSQFTLLPLFQSLCSIDWIHIHKKNTQKTRWFCSLCQLLPHPRWSGSQRSAWSSATSCWSPAVGRCRPGLLVPREHDTAPWRSAGPDEKWENQTPIISTSFYRKCSLWRKMSQILRWPCI